MVCCKEKKKKAVHCVKLISRTLAAAAAQGCCIWLDAIPEILAHECGMAGSLEQGVDVSSTFG